MNYEKSRALLITALVLSGCAPEARATRMPVTPAPTIEPTITIEPTVTSEAIDLSLAADQAAGLAAINFMDKVGQLLDHENGFIRQTAESFFQDIVNQEFMAYVNPPLLDEAGNVLEIPLNTSALFCAFTSQGVFEVTPESHTFYFNEISQEATAAFILACMEYRNGINDRYQQYLSDNPNITPNEALKNNQQWSNEASVEAWFQAVGRIIAPYRDRMPSNITVFDTYLIYHDSCGIDFSAHANNPEKAERDRNCWMRSFNRFEVQEV